MNFSSLKGTFSGMGSLGAAVGIGAGMRILGDKDNLGTAIAKEVPWAIAYGMMPASLMLGATLAPALTGAAVSGMKALTYNANQNWKNSHKVGPRFTYQDTDQALTMRQAAVQAIQGSKLNARNALGGEASLMHRGYGSRRA